MKLTDNARLILEKRYLKKENGVPVETPEEMFRRVAGAVAGAEKIFNPALTEEQLEDISLRFYQLMTSWDFLPNSPTLMNAGRELGQLSACFVLPVEDSMEAIFTAVKDAALIHKSGGGTGFSFSRLRPKNSPVRSTGGVASGPVSFMKVFNAATEAIKQGGTRRGANMGILRVDHPDILEFISCKENNNELTNFNISVGLTKEFMEALARDDYYELKFGGKVYQKLKAQQVFEEIVNHAWANGEPGIIFLDRLNEDNPTPELGEIEATNPCGEQPLLPYEACNLGSLNLANMVREGGVDWERLAETVYWSVRFLDNVIEINEFPLEKIKTMVMGNRKIGLGVMGWADMLFLLRIPYDTEEAVELGRRVMAFIQKEARQASRMLAEERGSFPNIDRSIYRGQKLRNATCTTIAPTGTISMIAGTSSGIEPVFALAYTKNVLDGESLIEVNPVFQAYIEENFAPDEARLIFQQIAAGTSIHDIKQIPPDMRRVFVTALEIAPEWHIRMQAAFQASTDNAVSKTVNFPPGATREDVRRVYELAYQLGCKGVTVYRSGSREQEVLVSGTKNTTVKTPSGQKTHPRPRPKRTCGVTEQVKTGCGKMYITVNYDQEGLIETFITTGSSGGCSGFTEGVSRLISLALRANIAPEAIIDQLTSVSCPNFLRRRATDKSIVGKSCPDIIGRVLAQELKNWHDHGSYQLPSDFSARALAEISATIENQQASFQPLSPAAEAELIQKGICPECGSNLHFQEGCVTCSCGFSKCG
ncbi:Ribonucleotide reductase,adenosylcobalamin-dependent [Moorella glycerini]|uniref:Vitamin B12-dependent ribonucleotide reductase n=1 Tax=Neomoorella stamsii TaxID=1266720 RepID=A0A9X7J0Z0_9FIRM|nr:MULTISPECIES: vitamin B12-dependent ribonucleotide reductase [Moorella]PRR71432.1 Ribonucleoside-diphosphate reductase NrdZ [Moorella stamsii]CEP68641.1 Ribonucleotide reductase,adenosylcobalamin-dependent [Moorella glycerini]